MQHVRRVLQVTQLSAVCVEGGKRCCGIRGRLQNEADFKGAVSQGTHVTPERMDKGDIGELFLESVSTFCYLENIISVREGESQWCLNGIPDTSPWTDTKRTSMVRWLCNADQVTGHHCTIKRRWLSSGCTAHSICRGQLRQSGQSERSDEVCWILKVHKTECTGQEKQETKG